MSAKLPRIALCVVIVAALVVTSVIFQSSTETDQKLTELRSRGIPTTVAEINDLYAIPEGKTDATKYWVAAIDALKDLKADPAKDTLPLVGYGTDPIPTPGQPWAQLDAAEAFLKSHRDVIDLIHTAAEANGVARYPVDFSSSVSDVNYAMDTRLAFKILELHAWVSHHRSDPPSVFADIRGMFAVSNSVMAEPTLTAQSIRQTMFSDACQSMLALSQHCRWTDQQLTELQLIVADIDILGELRRALTGDRASFLSTINDASLQQMNSITVESVIDLYEKFIVSMDSGWKKTLEANDDVEKGIREWSPEERSSEVNSAVAILFPAVRQAVAGAGETVTRQRAALLILAALRYELANGSRPTIPDNLKPFVDASFGEIWTDPFSQGPLNLSQDGSQLIVYGVGRDRKDDRGQITVNKSASRPNDIGFRF